MGACDPLAVPQSSLRDSPALRKSCDEPAAWAARVQVSSPRAACVQVSSPRPAKPTGLGCSGHRAPRLPDLRGEGPPRLSWSWACSVGKSLVLTSSSKARSDRVRAEKGNLSHKKLSAQHCAPQSSADAPCKTQCDDLTRRPLKATAEEAMSPPRARRRRCS